MTPDQTSDQKAQFRATLLGPESFIATHLTNRVPMESLMQIHSQRLISIDGLGSVLERNHVAVNGILQRSAKRLQRLSWVFYPVMR